MIILFNVLKLLICPRDYNELKKELNKQEINQVKQDTVRIYND